MVANYLEQKSPEHQRKILDICTYSLRLVSLNYILYSGLCVSLPIDLVLFIAQFRTPFTEKKLISRSIYYWSQSFFSHPANPSDQHHFIALSFICNLSSFITSLSLGFTHASLAILILWTTAYSLFVIGNGLENYLHPSNPNISFVKDKVDDNPPRNTR